MLLSEIEDVSSQLLHILLRFTAVFILNRHTCCLMYAFVLLIKGSKTCFFTEVRWKKIWVNLIGFHHFFCNIILLIGNIIRRVYDWEACEVFCAPTLKTQFLSNNCLPGINNNKKTSTSIILPHCFASHNAANIVLMFRNKPPRKRLRATIYTLIAQRGFEFMFSHLSQIKRHKGKIL